MFKYKKILFLFLSCLPFSITLANTVNDIQMLGAITGKKNAVALLKNKISNEVKAIKIGEKVFDIGVLIFVEREQITIKTSNNKKYIISSKFGGAVLLNEQISNKSSGDVNAEIYKENGLSRIGNKTEIDVAYKDKIIKEELGTVLMQAASEPVMENGVLVGFRLFQFENNSMFAKIGVKEGDVVKEINGIQLNNLQKTLQLLNNLKNEKNVNIIVDRNGTPTTLDMSVK